MHRTTRNGRILPCSSPIYSKLHPHNYGRLTLSELLMIAAFALMSFAVISNLKKGRGDD